MRSEQRIRAILFYLSVLIFLFGLPFILSVAFGYKFDRRAFKFTKTGLIVIRTQPPGAPVYLENNLLANRTPLTIDELLPAVYRLKIRLDQHYPWSGEVKVEAGQVTRLEKIILFPVRPNIRQLSKERASSFWLDEERGAAYYVDKEERCVYKSDLDGTNYEKIAAFPQLKSAPERFILSPDRKKILYFNQREAGVAYLEPHKERPFLAAGFVIDYAGPAIIHAFWHSDSYHLILVTDTTIGVLEAKIKSETITLVNLNKKNASCFYDLRNDALYFIDTQIAADGKFYDNLYKLDLNARVFPLQQFIKLKPSEGE